MEPETGVEKRALHLFEGYGIELEYMIVDQKTLNVMPICDALMQALSGAITTDFASGEISYSNELALHVVELKTTGPMDTLEGLSELFQEHVGRINQALLPFGATLLPSAAHPWMDPHQEMRLWEHEYNPIYESYHRIFNCRGHGWANLQSTHINLPFSGDEEFAKLHAAIRLLLPIMPALSASSPFLEGKETKYKDSRLWVYEENQRRIPSITGKVVPESITSYEGYQKNILEPMYRDIAALDPEGILQFEWLNSRGAIARFDRSTIEIRVLDIQECPQADIAIATAVTFALQRLVRQSPMDFSLESLTHIYKECVQKAEEALITDRDYLQLFGCKETVQAGTLWRHIVTGMRPNPFLEVILSQGSLATRLLKAHRHTSLVALYRQLTECLAHGKMFLA